MDVGNIDGMSKRMAMRKRVLGVSGLVLIVVLAGCLTVPASSPTNDSAGATEPLPTEPRGLNESAVESYVLEYERVRLVNRLDQRYKNDSFGVGCCTTSKHAVTITENSSHYYVRVRYPYYYVTDRGETDAASEAVYTVSENTTERVSLRARTISVDDPYSASNQSGNAAPPRVYVVNAAHNDRELSMTLSHLDRDETAFDRSIDLDGNASLEVSQIAHRKGEYRLAVSSEGEVTRHDFTVGEAGAGSVFVLFTDTKTVIQRVPNS